MSLSSASLQKAFSTIHSNGFLVQKYNFDKVIDEEMLKLWIKDLYLATESAFPEIVTVHLLYRSAMTSISSEQAFSISEIRPFLNKELGETNLAYAERNKPNNGSPACLYDIITDKSFSRSENESLPIEEKRLKKLSFVQNLKHFIAVNGNIIETNETYKKPEFPFIRLIVSANYKLNLIELSLKVEYDNIKGSIEHDLWSLSKEGHLVLVSKGERYTLSRK